MRRLTVTLCLISSLLCAAPPTVVKVDPPNWWAGHSINPVRLLLRGANLHGVRITIEARGFRTANIRVNDAGTYAFVDLSIPRSAQPGPLQFTVTTADGNATIPFAVSRPLARDGRFQGFSPNDLMYLIMPDRFADGDPSNDDPAISKGLLDRTKGRYYHGGDLQGIIDRLPYLKDLGVTAVWVNPVYDNVNHLNTRETYGGQAITDYHGYGAVDFYAVDEHLGTLDKFRELVDKAHQSGIKIIQDQVANHTGPFHPWVTDSPTPTWYN
jgi:neopullulanase